MKVPLSVFTGAHDCQPDSNANSTDDEYVEPFDCHVGHRYPTRRNEAIMSISGPIASEYRVDSGRG